MRPNSGEFGKNIAILSRGLGGNPRSGEGHATPLVYANVLCHNPIPISEIRILHTEENANGNSTFWLTQFCITIFPTTLVHIKPQLVTYLLSETTSDLNIYASLEIQINPIWQRCSTVLLLLWTTFFHSAAAQHAPLLTVLFLPLDYAYRGPHISSFSCAPPTSYSSYCSGYNHTTIANSKTKISHLFALIEQTKHQTAKNTLFTLGDDDRNSIEKLLDYFVYIFPFAPFFLSLAKIRCITFLTRCICIHSYAYNFPFFMLKPFFLNFHSNAIKCQLIIRGHSSALLPEAKTGLSFT